MALPEGLQAVLFDMDGICVDTEPLWFEAESAVMERLGGAWTAADQHALVGGSLTVTVEYLLHKAARPVPAEVVGRWLTDTIVALIVSRPLPVIPGARELVAEVAAARIPYALVTSSDREVMDAVLARFGPRFPVTVCAADVARTKPDPEGYLLAAGKLAVDPRRSVVIEDSLNGVAAAEAAGCPVVAVPSVVPIPPGPRRVVLSALSGLTLARLRSEYARLRAVPG